MRITLNATRYSALNLDKWTSTTPLPRNYLGDEKGIHVWFMFIYWPKAIQLVNAVEPALLVSIIEPNLMPMFSLKLYFVLFRSPL